MKPQCFNAIQAANAQAVEVTQQGIDITNVWPYHGIQELSQGIPQFFVDGTFISCVTGTLCSFILLPVAANITFTPSQVYWVSVGGEMPPNDGFFNFESLSKGKN